MCESVGGDDATVCQDTIMVYHGTALRHLMLSGQRKRLVWIDTRDTLADALTKGKISRGEIMNALNIGCWALKHACKQWFNNELPNIS